MRSYDLAGRLASPPGETASAFSKTPLEAYRNSFKALKETYLEPERKRDFLVRRAAGRGPARGEGKTRRKTRRRKISAHTKRRYSKKFPRTPFSEPHIKNSKTRGAWARAEIRENYFFAHAKTRYAKKFPRTPLSEPNIKNSKIQGARARAEIRENNFSRKAEARRQKRSADGRDRPYL